MASTKNIRGGPITHGKSRHGKHRLYSIWTGMRARCRDKGASNYERYGGRGIRVCGEWDDFTTFETWALANGYADDLSIDRIDGNGDYSPNNCRWATRAEQQRNTKRNVLVEIGGKNACVKDHAADAGVSYWALIKLIRRGVMSPEAAIQKLVDQQGKSGKRGKGSPNYPKGVFQRRKPTPC